MRVWLAVALLAAAAPAQRSIAARPPPPPRRRKVLKGQIAEATGQLRAWSFAPDKATVTYDPYAVGAYAEGLYSCEIPYATLKPLAKPGFPLPQQ